MEKFPIIDDQRLLSIASQLNKLTQSYCSGGLKHYQYVAEYDNLLSKNEITKKHLLHELKRRKLLF